MHACVMLTIYAASPPTLLPVARIWAPPCVHLLARQVPAKKAPRRAPADDDLSSSAGEGTQVAPPARSARPARAATRAPISDVMSTDGEDASDGEPGECVNDCVSRAPSAQRLPYYTALSPNPAAGVVSPRQESPSVRPCQRLCTPQAFWGPPTVQVSRAAEGSSSGLSRFP